MESVSGFVGEANTIPVADPNLQNVDSLRGALLRLKSVNAGAGRGSTVVTLTFV